MNSANNTGRISFLFSASRVAEHESTTCLFRMKQFRNAVCVLTILFAFLCSVPCASALPPNSAWALEQENPYAPSGKWTMTLGNTGIKCVDKSINLIIVTPQYNAFVSNSETKQFSAASHAEWLQTFFHKNINDEKSNGKYLRPGKKVGQIAGFNVKQHLLCMLESGKEKLLREVWITNDIDFPDDYCKILFQLCNLPPGTGVPLRVSRLLRDGNREVVLNTVKATKVTINKNTFKQPENYKKLRSATAVIFSESSNKDFNDILDSPVSP